LICFKQLRKSASSLICFVAAAFQSFLELSCFIIFHFIFRNKGNIAVFLSRTKISVNSLETFEVINLQHSLVGLHTLMAAIWNSLAYNLVETLIFYW